MYVGKLQKLSNNINALRTDSVFGIFEAKPKVGRSFAINSESLELKEAGALRYVWTSTVESIEIYDETEIVFKTMNSLYKLSDIKYVEAGDESHGSN